MPRIDLTPGRPLLAARQAVMAALPADGSPIGYARIALCAGEDCGTIVDTLIDQGMITECHIEGTRCYARTSH